MQSADALHVDTATGTQIGHTIAGPGSRAYAYIVDWHIRVLVVLVWYAAAALLLRVWELDVDATYKSMLIWVSIPPGLFYVLYHPVLETFMLGNSPGKVWTGVRVVDHNGLPPTTGSILVRNVFRLIDSFPLVYTVGIIATLVTRQHVRLGDLVAGTVLVQADDRAEETLAQIERARSASIDPAAAELVIDLLERWPTLGRQTRDDLARKLLRSQGIKPPVMHAELKQALQKLLKA